MSKTTLKIFIASSAELKEERERCIVILNKINKNYKHLDLEPVEWEYDIVQGNALGYENIQAGINPTLLQCQVIIFLFHSKIGKYTREEFELAKCENKKLFAYFKDGYTPTKNTLLTFSELLDFKETLNETVLYKDYKDLTDFELKISDHLHLYFSENYSFKSPTDDLSKLTQSNLELIRILGEKENELKELKRQDAKLPTKKMQLQIQKLSKDKEIIRKNLLQSEEVKKQLAKDKTALEIQLSTQKESDGLKAEALKEIEKGNYLIAEEYLKQSAEENIDAIASTFYELAKIKKLQLQYKEAFNYYELAVKINSNNSTYLNAAGLMGHDLGFYDKAIEYYKQALKIDLEYDENVDHDVSARYNNLGLAHDSKGEYDKAIVYYNKALKMKSNQDDNNSILEILYNNLGLAYCRKKEFDKGIKFYKKALKIGLEHHDENHAYIANCYNNLGSAYGNKGQYDKEIELYEKALKIDLRSHDAEHPNIAIRYNNLGLAYHGKGEYDKSIEFYNKALNIDLKYKSEKHPSIAIRYNNLGLAYNKKAEYNKAIKYYEKSLLIFKIFLPINHPNIQTVQKNLDAAKQVE